jgi:dolichol kinase
MQRMSFRHEVLRKAIHLCTLVFPLVYLLSSRWCALALAVPVTLAFIAVDLLRQRQPRIRSLYDRYLSPLMRAHEQSQLCGASHVMIAVTLCILLYQREVAVAAMLFLTVSDALASLVGRALARPGQSGKSIAGSAAFLASASLLAIMCLPGRPLAALAGAVAATVAEAVPVRVGRVHVDDNLTVPIVSGAVMTAALCLR